MKIPHDMQEQGCDVDQAIDTVQDPTMTRNDSAHVFNAYVPLNHTDGQVPQLPPDADDESYQDTVPRLEVQGR